MKTCVFTPPHETGIIVAHIKATVQNAKAPWEIDPTLKLTALTCAAPLGPVRHGTLAIG